MPLNFPTACRYFCCLSLSLCLLAFQRRPLSAHPSPPRRLPWGTGPSLALPIMALFCLVALVFSVGFYADDSFAASTTASLEGKEVTYGSVIKLMHVRTKFRLHSHDVSYGSGSGQQSVTGFGGVDDANSYWIVKAPKDSGSQQGDAVTDGSVIKLQHMRTRRWLHSHLHRSPISGNLEVSCFGSDDESDTGDLWMLETEGKRRLWTREQKVRFQHVDTGSFLHSHDKKYTHIVDGQQEVCGVMKKTSDNLWLVAEGVYLPANSKASS